MSETVILEIKDLAFKTDEVLTEVIKTILPDRIKTYLSSKNKRNLMLEKFGKKAFLLPEKLKFPVVDPNTGKAHCGLIYAARIRAKQFSGKKPGYRELAKKAEKLYKDNSCQNKIHVQLKESKEESNIELLELLNAIDIQY